MKEDQRRAGEYWSKLSVEENRKVRSSWGTSSIIRNHVCKLLTGEPGASGLWSLFRRCRLKHGINSFGRAVSVGAGDGVREINLVVNNVVEHFTLYEVSSVRAEKAKRLALEKGVDDRVEVILRDDAFTDFSVTDYDLVLWWHALHHMPDAYAAIDWSYRVLRNGGALVMYEFVGAPRFQWSDEALEHASRARRILPDNLLQDPIDPDVTIPTNVRRPPREKLIARDPTEAIDSDRIVPAIMQKFESVDLVWLGGIIYHLALNDVIGNFDEVNDRSLLNALLLYDEQLSRQGLNNFAAGIAIK